MNTATAAASMEPLHDPINRNPFLKLVGARLEEAGDGRSRYSLELRPELVNIHQAAHGGVIMTVLDAAMASAAVSKTNFTTIVMTIDMSISFMRPGSGKLSVHGRVVGGGSTVCFCEAEIKDESGETVAKALGSFRHWKKNRAGAALSE
jgi:uncharacterized protein (TIGR00369 family)